MVAVKEPVVVFETKDGGFLFGNYLFFHYDRKSSTPYMSVEMRSGLYPQSLKLKWNYEKTRDWVKKKYSRTRGLCPKHQWRRSC